MSSLVSSSSRTVYRTFDCNILVSQSAQLLYLECTFSTMAIIHKVHFTDPQRDGMLCKPPGSGPRIHRYTSLLDTLKPIRYCKQPGNDDLRLNKELNFATFG